MGRPPRIGLVVHPSRAIDEPLTAVRDWATAHGADLLQVEAPCQQQSVASPGAAEDCELIVSIGGDGTTLAAIHAGTDAGRPVLGVTFGSLGALTAVAPGGVARALDRFQAGDWEPRRLPALEGTVDREHGFRAVNDLAIVRAGQGQVRVVATLDGERYGRFAGDGCIVSTAIGSSGYGFAAGGPLLAAGLDAFVLTPLTMHGGSCGPLVIGPGSALELEVSGHGGSRLEVDGQVARSDPSHLRVALRPRVATIVGFNDQEPFLTGLRRRQIIADSPRILADES